jgi:hypothetical protein
MKFCEYFGVWGGVGLFWDDGVEGVGVEVEGGFAEKAWRAYRIHLNIGRPQREEIYVFKCNWQQFLSRGGPPGEMLPVFFSPV